MAERRLPGGTLGEVLVSRRRRCFVGRDGELELVRAALEAREPQFSVLWFSGPGGIGKTSLLEAIAELAEAAGGWKVVRLDGRELPSSSRVALEVVREALGTTEGDEAIAAPEGRLVLLFDAYEQAGGLDEWVRTWLLPRLPATAITVVAGRQLPGPGWRADAAWRELLRVVSLRNLGPEESRSYLRACGIDEALHGRLVEVSHGHPLGLSLLVDVVGRGGEATLDPAPDLVGTLIRRFVDVVPAGRRRGALEVCALARVTTEALLRDALALEDAQELFAWLRELSFVEAGPDGLRPHDLARDVLDADLRWRDPDGYKDLFRRVCGHIHTVLKSSRGREQQRSVFDLKFLFRYLRSALAPVDWDVWGLHYPEPARRADGGSILELVAAAEGEAAAAIAERWFDVQLEGFVVVRGEDDEVRGFVALLDLTVASEQDRRADPGAEAAWDYAHRCSPPRPGEVITQTRFVVDRDVYQGPSSTLNALPMVTLQRYLVNGRLAWDFLTLHEPEPWDAYFALVDQPRATGADFLVGGRRYGLYGHDFRRVGVDALMELWTERALAEDVTLRPAVPDDVLVLSQADFTSAVRQALRDLHRPELLARNPLIRTRLARLRPRRGARRGDAGGLAGGRGERAAPASPRRQAAAGGGAHVPAPCAHPRGRRRGARAAVQHLPAPPLPGCGAHRRLAVGPRGLRQRT